jgi:hypothetical protein
VATEDDYQRLTTEVVNQQESGYLMGIVLGFSYPEDTQVVVSYFNPDEYDQPIIKEVPRDTLVLLRSPIQDLITTYKLSTILANQDFEDTVMNEILKETDPEDPEDEGSDSGSGGDSGGGRIVH